MNLEIGGALSSISLSIQRAPPLSNSLHTIYLVPFCICIFYYFSVSLYLVLCSVVLLNICIVRNFKLYVVNLNDNETETETGIKTRPKYKAIKK